MRSESNPVLERGGGRHIGTLRRPAETPDLSRRSVHFSQTQLINRDILGTISFFKISPWVFFGPGHANKKIFLGIHSLGHALKIIRMIGLDPQFSTDGERTSGSGEEPFVH